MKFAEKIIQAGNTRLFIILPAAVLILTLCFITVFSYQYGTQWIDSDHSSEMLLGQILSDENKLVTGSWFYSNEIRLVYQTIFTMPLFKLLGKLGNWALIRALNILLNNIVLILSYVFLMKSMGIKTKWSLISALFLLMPLSLPYWTIVTFGGYYVFFAVQLFCCLGLFVRLVADKGNVKTKRADFILFAILSFTLGVQGMRSLMAIHVPLLLASLLIWLGKKKAPVLFGCAGFAACCAGYAVNNLLHYRYSFYSFGITQIDNLFSNFIHKLGRCLVNIAGYFGLAAGGPLFSAQGFFSICAIIAALVLLRVVYKTFSRVRTENESSFMPAALMRVFFAVSLTFNIFVFIVVEQNIIDRYFIPFMILYVPLTAVLFDYAEHNYNPLKRLALVCGITLFIAGQGCFNFKTFAAWDINSIRKGYVQYLLDNKLGFGFATFWNANVTTELTNGKIEVTGLRPGTDSIAAQNLNQFGMYEYLLPVKYKNAYYKEGESFLLLSSREWESFSRRRAVSKVIPGYQDENFVVIKYPSAELIHKEVLGN